jgi:hypothetical protein
MSQLGKKENGFSKQSELPNPSCWWDHLSVPSCWMLALIQTSYQLTLLSPTTRCSCFHSLKSIGKFVMKALKAWVGHSCWKVVLRLASVVSVSYSVIWNNVK